MDTARGRQPFQGADHLAALVEHLEPDAAALCAGVPIRCAPVRIAVRPLPGCRFLVGETGPQRVGDERAVGRILSRPHAVAHPVAAEGPRVTVGRAAGEQVELLAREPVAPLAQDAHVVEEEEAAAVGRDEQVVELGLEDDVVDRRRGEVGEGEFPPGRSAVATHIEAELGADVEDVGIEAVLADHPDPALARQAVRDPAPRPAEVLGDEQPGAQVVEHVAVERDVAAAGFEA